MKIKKYYKPGVALTLAFVLVVPSLPFGIKPMKVKAELQTSAMGNFAQWYGQEYQRKQAEKNNNNNSDSGANKDFGMPSPPKKGTYEATVTNDIAKGIETYSINAFADWSKKEIANYLTKGDKKEINKLWGQLTKQYHESTVMKKAPYKNINKTANKINMKSSKVSKITKRVGTGVNVVMAGKGLYDMYNQPNVGYKSPFLEFCANSVRGMSAVSNVILPEGSWAYGVVEGVVTSETLVKYVNDKNFKAGPLDDWVDTFNKYYQNKFEQWFFGDQLKTVEENEKRIQLAKQYCQGASCNANGVNVYKPNIYLYPEKTLK
ncbi:MAG: hypothetical protein IKN54_04590 [Lachnospiraceae bacterium]|nr:hypothetical protein [Lachnospiraceae bacterium]